MKPFNYLSLPRRNAIAAVLFAALIPGAQAQEQGKTAKAQNPAGGFDAITKEGYEAFVRLMVDFAKDQIGKLRMHVKVEELQHPKLTTTAEQAATDWKRFVRG